MYEEPIIKQPKKKKLNLWVIGLLVLVFAFSIVIWEGGKYHYGEWRQEIYDIAYNQSYIDTIYSIASAQGNTGNIIFIENNTIASRNIQDICGVE